MKFNARLIGASEMKKTLDQFAKLTGKGVEQGIKEMALSTARQLATKVQPYGIGEGKNQKGAKFLKSIAFQVSTAWFGVNVGAYPATTSMEQAHRQARNSRGVVPFRKFQKQRGKPWLGLISETERDDYIRKVQAKAGRAKAAWITAGNSIGVGKVSGVPKWISRHVGSGHGKHMMLGKMLKAAVEMENETPYLSGLQKSSEIRSALATGRKNALKRLQIVIDAELKKLKP